MFKTIYIDWSGGLLETSKMQAFPSCGVIRGRKFNVPREKRIDETPQRSEEAQHLPEESEQAGAEINKFPYFHGLNWIINTPDTVSYFTY